MLVALSLVVFLVQRTSWAIFDTVFEVSIFHIPALFSAALNLKFRGTSEAKRRIYRARKSTPGLY